MKDTLIEDILNLKMELLVLMQMAGGWGGGGEAVNFSRTILSSITSCLVWIISINMLFAE